uniref:Uncharacterized protein n=1 Tax=Acrobeloides nanus TaxID=290746 RepID=A0A914CY13_9BILA
MNFSSPDVLDAVFVNISGKWPSDMATNQKWVTTYAQAAERALLSGSAFLSDKNTWENNFGTNFFVPGLDSDEGTNITWWRRWDGQANDNGFIPYSTFQSPILKQYAGQVKKCGVNINLNVGFCYQPLLPPNCTCCAFSQNNQNCGSNK